MKIAVPVNVKSMDSEVCTSFGCAPYFLIFDTDTKEAVFLDNATAAGTEGAGIKAAQGIVDNEVKVLLSPSLGRNSADVLKAAGIEIYRTQAVPAKNSIAAFTAGDLPVLKAEK
ncbi:MAG: dinitrogenase iron-molybdenum cofactor biosynthesis protein [Firmicutes bacterium]|nr:dinitrogenase iron-molybdenum cofactor biosynthesis protein [Bacillota bacterium]